jgi:deoxyribonuclease-4
MSSNIIIGRHCLVVKPDYLCGAVEEALSYQANALMIYLGAPQNSRRRKISAAEITAFQQLLAAKNIPRERVVVHASYLVNLANDDEVKFN